MSNGEPTKDFILTMIALRDAAIGRGMELLSRDEILAYVDEIRTGSSRHRDDRKHVCCANERNQAMSADSLVFGNSKLCSKCYVAGKPCGCTPEAMSDTLKRAEQRFSCYTKTKCDRCSSGTSRMVLNDFGDSGDWVPYQEAEACDDERKRLEAKVTKIQKECIIYIEADKQQVAEMELLHSEVKALREENASLRVTLRGGTYFHSDELVNAELTSLRDVVEKVRDYAELLSLKGDYAGSGNILSLLPEVPK